METLFNSVLLKKVRTNKIYEKLHANALSIHRTKQTFHGLWFGEKGNIAVNVNYNLEAN